MSPETNIPEFNAALEQDERLLWTGRPVPRFFDTSSRSSCTFGVLMLMFCAWFGALLAGFAITDGSLMLILFVAVIFILVLIGAYLVASPLRLYRNMKRTAYAISDKRVIIIRAGKVHYTAPLGPGLLKDRHVRPDGGGDLIFDTEETHQSNNTTILRNIGFINLPELRQVEGILFPLIYGTAPAATQTPDHVSDLDRDAREYLQNCLLPGEKLLWARRPEPKFFRGQMRDILFGIAWLSLVALFTWVEIASEPTGTKNDGNLPYWFLAVFMLPFQLSCVFAIPLPFREFSARRRTVYAVTDKRILQLVRRRDGYGHESYPLNPHSHRKLSTHSDGSGDITFLYKGKETTFHEVPGVTTLDAIVEELARNRQAS